MAKSPGQLEMDRAITERMVRFSNALSSAVYARSHGDLDPVMTEVDELLTNSCILERLVFAVNVLKTAGVPRPVIDRLLADNFLVARVLTQAGYGLDDERTIRLLATRDETFHLNVASHDGISERITDYLVETGGSEVAYRLARNTRARLSPASMIALVERSQHDHRLLQALANRRDLDGAIKTEDDNATSSGLHARSAPTEHSLVKAPKRAPSRSKFIKHK